jgi:hypothetical protein
LNDELALTFKYLSERTFCHVVSKQKADWLGRLGI